MKRYITILFFFFALAYVKGQPPQMAVFFNNEAVDSMGNYSFNTGGVSYSSTYYEEATHSIYFRNGQQDDATTTTELNLNTGAGLTISFWFRNGQTTGAPYPFAFQANGLKAYLDAANRRVYFRDAYATDNAGTGTGVYSYNTWTHAVFIKYSATSQYGRIYIDGVDQTTDSIMNSPVDYTNALTIGNLTADGWSSFSGYIDNFQYYNYALTDAQIDSLYDNGTTNFILGVAGGGGGGEGTYTPTTGRHVWFMRAGAQQIIRQAGLFRYAIAKNIISSTYPIAHDQDVTIAEENAADDVVLELNYNRNYEKRGTLTWTETGGTGADYFAIADSTVKIQAHAADGSYTLTYSVTDGFLTGTGTVNITVIDSSLTYLVGVGGDYTNMNFTQVSGRYYFLKRGQEFSVTTPEYISQDNVFYGAYGVGTRPILKAAISLGDSYGLIDITNRSNITIRDIDLYSSAGGLATVFTHGICYNVTFDNCEIRSNAATRTYQLMRIAQIYGGGLKNCLIHETLEDGVYVFGWGGASSDDMVTVEGNYVYNVNSRGSAGNGDCMDWGASSAYFSNYCHFKYNLLDRSNTTYKHCLKYIANYNGTASGSIIEHNRMECYNAYNDWGQAGLSVYLAPECIIRYNVIKNGTRGFYTPNTSGEPQYNVTNGNINLEIYGNLIINSWFAAIELNNVTDNAEIYNNTIVDYATYNANTPRGIYVWSGCSGVKVKNNIIHTTSGYDDYPIYDNNGDVEEDYNLFFPDDGSWTRGTHSLEGDPLFVNGRHSAYEINTYSPAYHAGTDLAIEYDLYGVQWSTTPSMGYKEYGAAVPTTPVTADYYFCAVDGNDANDGLTASTPKQTLTELNSIIAGAATATTIAISDTAYYGNIIIHSANDITLVGWNKYGNISPTIYGTKQLTSWSSAGTNLWTKSDVVLPDTEKDYYENQDTDNGIALLNGLFINGTWYQNARTPNTGWYEMEGVASDFLSYFDDTDLSMTTNQYQNAYAYINVEDWLADKVKIASNTATRFNLTSSYFTSGYSLKHYTSGTKLGYALFNTTPDQNGEWKYDYATQTITLYHTTNPSSLTIYAPVEDSIISIDDSYNITLKDISTWGSHKYNISIKNSHDITTEYVNTDYSAYAGIYIYNSYDIYHRYDTVMNANGAGIFFQGSLAGDEQVVGCWIDGVGSTPGWDDAIAGYYGLYSKNPKSNLLYQRNYIAHTGYSGIAAIAYDGLAHGTFSIANNYITDFCEHLTDGGGIYVHQFMLNKAKSINNNLVVNQGTDYSFMRRNYPITQGIYLDEKQAYTTVTNNTTVGVGVGFFNQYNSNNNSFTYNLSVDHDVDGYYSYQSGFYKEGPFDGNANYLTWQYNTVVATDETGSTGFTWGDDNTPSFTGMTINNNYYFNPFRSDSKIIGSRHNWGDKQLYTLAEWGTYIGWELGSTYNQNNWTFDDVTGISEADFTQVFSNWSDASHSFSLGNCVFIDTDGDTVSGSISVGAFDSEVLFYVSGTIGTIDENIYTP
jgi:hypothetical protein